MAATTKIGWLHDGHNFFSLPHDGIVPRALWENQDEDWSNSVNRSRFSTLYRNTTTSKGWEFFLHNNDRRNESFIALKGYLGPAEQDLMMLKTSSLLQWNHRIWNYILNTSFNSEEHLTLLSQKRKPSCPIVSSPDHSVLMTRSHTELISGPLMKV